jgi:hypothetical protein
MKDAPFGMTALRVLTIAIAAAIVVPLTPLTASASGSTNLPKAPAGWQLVKSEYVNVFRDVQAKILRPSLIEIRLVGKLGHGPLHTSAAIQLQCAGSLYASNRYSAGLYPVPVPKDAKSCNMNILIVGIQGRVGVQILARTTTPTPTPTPAPTAFPYDGQWSGTFTFTLNLPAVQVDYYVTNPAESVVVTAPMTVDVTNGVVVVALASTDDDANVYDFEQNVDDQPTVTASGLATFSNVGGSSSVNEVTVDENAYFGDPSRDESGCSAAIQFTGTTAVSPGPISCQGIDDSGNAASITGGKITLSLASTSTVTA